MKYSNNYSAYIESLKLEKSQKSFKALIESTKESKNNDIVINNVFSKKNQDEIGYENKDYSSSESKEIGYENNSLSNHANTVINHEIDIINPNDYSSIQKHHDTGFVNRDDDSLSFDISESEKKEQNVSNVSIDSEKEQTNILLNNELTKKEPNDISIKNELFKKTSEDLNKEILYTKKPSDEISAVDNFPERSGISLDKNYDLDKKSDDNISNEFLVSKKDSENISSDEIISGKNSDNISKEIFLSKKDDNSITKDTIASRKDSDNIITDVLVSNKETKNIDKDQDPSNKSEAEIIASIKIEKRNAKKLSVTMVGNSKAKDSFENQVKDPEKYELTNLNRQFQYFLLDDSKADEQKQYDKYADKYGYYPSGSYEDIRKTQSRAMSDIFGMITTPDNWSGGSLSTSIINGVAQGARFASDVIDSIGLTGPAINAYIEGKTANKLRKDLKISDNELKGKKNEGFVIEDKTKSSFTLHLAENSNRWIDNYGSLGKIYVIPPYKELSGTIREGNNGSSNIAFTIPLQNNLEFENLSRAAAYNAIEFFGRIGEVQQYSRTKSLDGINITTKYFVEEDTEGNGFFNMPNLQDIEMKYRSLVLPVENKSIYINDDDREGNRFNYFTRPPVINIVLGRNSDDSVLPNLTDENVKERDVYHNLFTDIITTRGANGLVTHKVKYKNFIVTNVTIDKNQKDYNYFVEGPEGSETYKDLMGFTVTLTVMEIDENYLNSTPSFNNYFNTLYSRENYNVR